MIEKPPIKMDFGALFLLAISMRNRMDLLKDLMQSVCQEFQEERQKTQLSKIKHISCALNSPNRPHYEASIRVHVLVNELYPTFTLESLGATSLLFLENAPQASPDPFDQYDDVLRTKALNYSSSPLFGGDDLDSLLLANNISLSSMMSNSQTRLDSELSMSTEMVNQADDMINISNAMLTTGIQESSENITHETSDAVTSASVQSDEVPHDLLAGLSMDDMPPSVDSGMFNDEDDEDNFFGERLSSVASDDYTIPKEPKLEEGPLSLPEVKLEPHDLMRLPSFAAMSSIDSDIFGSPVDGLPSDDFLRQLGGSIDADIDIKTEPIENVEDVDIKSDILYENDMSIDDYNSTSGATANPPSFSIRRSFGTTYSSGQASVSSLSSPSRPADDFCVSYNSRRPTTLSRREDSTRSGSDRVWRHSRHHDSRLVATGRTQVSSLHGSSADNPEMEFRSMSSPRSSQFSQYGDDAEDDSVCSESTENSSSRKRSRRRDLNIDLNVVRGDQSLKDVIFLREAGVPFSYSDVAYSSNETFRQMRSTLGLTEEKINAMLDARRRATNRKAAERCRQQKNLERDDLSTQLSKVCDKKRDMERQVVKARHRRERARDALMNTHEELFSRLRDANNLPLQPDQWRFQFTEEGGLILVKRTDPMT